MLKHVRAATPEEVEAIRSKSTFPPQFTVLAMDQNPGEPDIAVVKHVVMLDPVFFGKRTNDVQKAKFVFALEERMMGAGIPEYYTRVDAADERWRKVLGTWGCKEISPQPDILYIKDLTNGNN